MSIRSLMNLRARVERGTATRTATGGPTRTWAVTAREVPMRIQPLSANLVVEFSKAGMRVTHKGYSAQSLTLTVADRIVVGGVTYEVRGFTDTDLAGRLRVAWLERQT